jgi:hypothetical protein
VETVYPHVPVNFSNQIACLAETRNILSNCSRAFSPSCSARHIVLDQKFTPAHFQPIEDTP